MSKRTFFILLFLCLLIFVVSCKKTQDQGETSLVQDSGSSNENTQNSQQAEDREGAETIEQVQEQPLEEKKVSCGDGLCNTEENCESCQEDCKCGDMEICFQQSCIKIECKTDQDCGENTPCKTYECLFGGTRYARCKVEEITSCTSGDNCCPENCEDIDTDCMPLEEQNQTEQGSGGNNGGTTSLKQCNDNVDNDGDDLIDFGNSTFNDPNCASLDDNSEYAECGNSICEVPDEDQRNCSADCGGTLIPACNNGRDDDMDGYTDYSSDSECLDINDNNEAPFCGNSICEAPYENQSTCFADCAYSLFNPCAGGSYCLNDSECNINYYCNINISTCCLLPYCSNNLDDDGDGFIDYPNDPECESANEWGEEARCGNFICENGESYTICPDDCFSICGNLICEAPAETPEMCSVDC